MPRGVVPIRGSDLEYDSWKRAAESQGLRFSAWARRVLNEEAALVLSVHVDAEQAKTERLQLRNTAFPSQHTPGNYSGGKKTYKPDLR